MIAKKWTTDELASHLMTYPPGTPVVAVGDDGSGYTFELCGAIKVGPAVEVFPTKYPPTGAVALAGVPWDRE